MVAWKDSENVRNHHFEVQLDGRKVRKHADQLRSRTHSESTSPVVEEAEIDNPYDARIPRQSDTEPSVNQSNATPHSTQPSSSNDQISNVLSTFNTSNSFDTPHNANENDTVVEQNASLIEFRRSSRVRNLPDRYGQ